MKANDFLMQHFSEQVGGEPQAYYLYQRFQEAFPQVNSATRIELVAYREVRIVLDFRSVPYPVTEYIAGWKARLWRVTGHLFNRLKWIERGQTQNWKIAAIPVEFTKTLRLERFVWQLQYYAPLQPLEGTGSIAVAYDGCRDTLYIYDDRRQNHDRP